MSESGALSDFNVLGQFHSYRDGLNPKNSHSIPSTTEVDDDTVYAFPWNVATAVRFHGMVPSFFPNFEGFTNSGAIVDPIVDVRLVMSTPTSPTSGNQIRLKVYFACDKGTSSQYDLDDTTVPYVSKELTVDVDPWNEHQRNLVDLTIEGMDITAGRVFDVKVLRDTSHSGDTYNNLLYLESLEVYNPRYNVTEL